VREFGIRRALGAREANIMRLVVKQALGLIALGLGLGLAGAAAFAHLLKTFLFQVGPLDPIVFVAVPLFLAAVILLASYVPARRAAKIDPMVALRCE
jgi:putative ABC transport system permease protein